jgi:hypothetical protein
VKKKKKYKKDKKIKKIRPLQNLRKSHRFVLRKKLNENKPKRHKMGKIIKMQFCPCGTKDLFIKVVSYCFMLTFLLSGISFTRLCPPPGGHSGC